MGRRVSETAGGATTKFCYIGQSSLVAYKTDGSGNLLQSYTYGPTGSPLTVTTWSGGTGTTYYYHENGHGDVVALTDSSGNTVAQYSYDAWGNILSSSGTLGNTNPYLYARYRWDSAIGMYYLNARYYAPNLMRFISKDPVTGLNAYTYADDNPVMNVDLSGEWTLTGVFGAIDSIGSDLLSTFTDAVSGFLDGIEGGPWAAAVGAIYGVIKSSIITVSGGDLPYPYQASTTRSGSYHSASEGQGDTSSAGSPDPRKKPKKMIGENGTRTSSKTIWKAKDGSGGRLDVENPNPGGRPEQIHYQVNGEKYLFDQEANSFIGAPNRVNSLLNDSQFLKALNKGLAQYLGEDPINIP